MGPRGLSIYPWDKGSELLEPPRLGPDRSSVPRDILYQSLQSLRGTFLKSSRQRFHLDGGRFSGSQGLLVLSLSVPSSTRISSMMLFRGIVLVLVPVF